jgi:uncharacterized protein YkwD
MTMLHLIEAARALHHVHALHSVPMLVHAARLHSHHMAHCRVLYHGDFVHTRHFGQCVGYGTRHPLGMFRAFMASREHRHIILYRGFRHIGIGRWGHWWTLNFS